MTTPDPLDLDAIEAAIQHWQPTEWNRRTIRNLVAEVRELKRDLQQTDEAWTESVQEHQARIRELVAERDRLIEQGMTQARVIRERNAERKQLTAERDRLAETVARVRERHHEVAGDWKDDGRTWCNECDDPWPCATTQDLDEAQP